jgi:hypothetical protein
VSAKNLVFEMKIKVQYPDQIHRVVGFSCSWLLLVSYGDVIFFLILGCYRLWVRSEAVLDSKKNVVFLLSGLKCYGLIR